MFVEATSKPRHNGTMASPSLVSALNVTQRQNRKWEASLPGSAIRHRMAYILYLYTTFDDCLLVSKFLPRDAMRQRVLCCRPVSVCLSVCPSVCDVGGLYPHG